MEITENHLRQVAFLCAEVERRPGSVERVPGGTVFFVLVETDGTYVSYAVTARHCIEDSVGPLYLRVNVDDTYDDIEVRPEDWFIHESADVAVARFVGRRPGGYTLSAVNLESFVRGDYTVPVNPDMQTYQGIIEGVLTPAPAIPIRPGNEVFFAGLFVQDYGRKQNLPIARFGQIARMPVEPIRISSKSLGVREVLAYLVECRSWGGHSGSPVYWRHPVAHLVEVDAPSEPGVRKWTKNGKLLIQNPGADVTALLGLVSGHYDIAQKAQTGEERSHGTITTAINSGIAIVTPAEAIRELLMREDVVADRNEEVARTKSGRDAATAASPDTALGVAEDRVSLAPLSPEQALRGLLGTPPRKPQD